MSMRLNNKIAMITGAGSGIGRQIATLFAKEGSRVALLDCEVAAVESAASEIPGSAERCVPIVCDVANSDSVAAAVSLIVGKWGGLNIVCTAAGISLGNAVTETSVDAWDQVFAVNAKGTFLCLRAAIPHIVAAGGGSIITIATQLAIAGGRNNAAYVSSKGAVISLTRSVALDYAASGIRANVILPGAIVTPMLEKSFLRQLDPLAAREVSRLRHPLRRFGTVDEVALAALFLASEESAFTTGIELPVDGGWLIG
jgi:NAD(P)-dependent dehydrogenase (short-subunit alcohol dehydrogenase family)